ncbi:MAG TPA: methyltransferase domain-containing protein [Gammaproteobacteria bacterium]|nr:methyltransferase domain-containing protein [Gammaproteobacteria bacterium]
MSRRGAQFALPDSLAARRTFDRAAPAFDSACVVHDEARLRLLERLDMLRLTPSVVVDLGSATGKGAAALTERYPAARVLAVDASLGMLAAGRARAPSGVAGDAQRLPLTAGSVQLIFANMVLPWCRPEHLFGEAARVLAEGGLALFATVGPDTLEQVRRAWAAVDDQVHVHALFDMHDLGDLAAVAGLAEPVIDADRLELTYRDAGTMIADLRACGAINVAAGRRRGLTGPGRWRDFEQALLAGRRNDGRFGVTIELILGQAWGTAPLAHRRSGPAVRR